MPAVFADILTSHGMQLEYCLPQVNKISFYFAFLISLSSKVYRMLHRKCLCPTCLKILWVTVDLPIYYNSLDGHPVILADFKISHMLKKSRHQHISHFSIHAISSALCSVYQRTTGILPVVIALYILFEMKAQPSYRSLKC